MRWFLIDRYQDIQPEESLRAIKLLSNNERFLEQNYPWNPIFPPTLMIEMMAQAGGVLTGINMGFQKEVILGKVVEADFQRPISPPASLTIVAKTISQEVQASWTEMTIQDEEGVFAHSKIMFALLDKFKEVSGEGSLVFNDNFLAQYNLAQYKGNLKSVPSRELI